MRKVPWTLLLGVFCGLLAVSPGCGGLRLGPPDRTDPAGKAVRTTAPGARPGRHELRIAPYVFLSDYELSRDQALFKDLAGLRDQVYKELQLPSTETPVLVYLFEDARRYESYMQERYPKLPPRRAFFVAQPRAMGGEDLMVFTSRSNRIEQDLRHELTHALLHSVLKDVPLWLDEGLAEYFELPRDHQGVNAVHLDQIRRSTVEAFKPDLVRLEKLAEVQQMTPAEYREGWAWAHFLLRSRPEVKAVLLDYLQQLRTNPTPGSLRDRLVRVVPDPERALSAHVAAIVIPRAATAHR
jgi:hypothetical protein